MLSCRSCVHAPIEWRLRAGRPPARARSSARRRRRTTFAVPRTLLLAHAQALGGLVTGWRLGGRATAALSRALSISWRPTMRLPARAGRFFATCVRAALRPRRRTWHVTGRRFFDPMRRDAACVCRRGWQHICSRRITHTRAPGETARAATPSRHLTHMTGATTGPLSSLL